MVLFHRDAHSKELLKVFYIDGQVENHIEISSTHDSPFEDKMSVMIASTSKKEKFELSV